MVIKMAPNVCTSHMSPTARTFHPFLHRLSAWACAGAGAGGGLGALAVPLGSVLSWSRGHRLARRGGIQAGRILHGAIRAHPDPTALARPQPVPGRPAPPRVTSATARGAGIGSWCWGMLPLSRPVLPWRTSTCSVIVVCRSSSPYGRIPGSGRECGLRGGSPRPRLCRCHGSVRPAQPCRVVRTPPHTNPGCARLPTRSCASAWGGAGAGAGGGGLAGRRREKPKHPRVQHRPRADDFGLNLHVQGGKCLQGEVF